MVMQRTRAIVGAAIVLAIAAVAIYLVPRMWPLAVQEPPEPVEIVAAVPSEIEGTDMTQVPTHTDLVHGLISTPPISLGLKNDQVLPWAAKAVQVSPDGREIRLTFDRGLLFSNGVPVTAEAVKRSIERYKKLSPYGFDWDPVREIVVDGDTLVLRLPKPAPGLMVVLGSVYAAPVEVGAAQQMGDAAFNRKAVSYGPFVVGEWVDGSHITLVRNDKYREFLPLVRNRGPSRISRVTVRFIPEAFTRVSELRAGRVHLIAGVPDDLVPALRDDRNITVHDFLAPNVRHLQMHTERFPFQDRRVRLAAAHIVDRDKLAGALNNTIQPVFGLVGEAMMSHDAATEAELSRTFATNVDRARELLREAGWAPGPDGIFAKDGRRLRFVLSLSTEAVDKKAAPVLQAQFREAGMEVELREFDARALRARIEAKDYDMVLRNWTWLDPGGVWPGNLRSDGRFTQWSHPEVDALIDAAIPVPDPAERARRWGALSRRVWQDVPVVPLWSNRTFVAARRTVTGLVLSVDGRMHFQDLAVGSE
jgi:peptide/nickel transport system substrate-binding protein